MQENKTNVKAIISLVLACLSLVCCCIWYVGMIFGIAAVVLGILAMRDNHVKKTDVAIAGIVVGGVGVAMGIAVAILYILVYSGIASDEIVAAATSIQSTYMR